MPCCLSALALTDSSTLWSKSAKARVKLYRIEREVKDLSEKERLPQGRADEVADLAQLAHPKISIDRYTHPLTVRALIYDATVTVELGMPDAYEKKPLTGLFLTDNSFSLLLT